MNKTRLYLIILTYLALQAPLASFANESHANRPPTPEAAQLYNGLKKADKEKFQETRNSMLAKVEASLRKTQWALGTGIYLKDKILFWKETSEMPRSQRSEDLIQTVVKVVDLKLWSQPRLLTRLNEFGFNLSVSLAAEGGAAGKYWGGLREIGINLGYNKELKALTFQIFRQSEKIQNSPLGFSVLVAAAFKGGIYLSSVEKNKIHETKQGTTFYPPGAPVYSTSIKNILAAGAFIPVGFPPFPFDATISFNNKTEHRNLLRITVSPFQPGFVRMSIDKLILQPITEMIDLLLRRGGSAGLCQSVFVH